MKHPPPVRRDISMAFRMRLKHLIQRQEGNDEPTYEEPHLEQDLDVEERQICKRVNELNRGVSYLNEQAQFLKSIRKLMKKKPGGHSPQPQDLQSAESSPEMMPRRLTAQAPQPAKISILMKRSKTLDARQLLNEEHIQIEQQVDHLHSFFFNSHFISLFNSHLNSI